jgi:hypothetical protein
MQSKSGSHPETYVLPHNGTLTAEEAGKLHGATLATWLATVALVLIVIGAALSLAAWRERKKPTEGGGAQIMFSFGFCDNVQLVASSALNP